MAYQPAQYKPRGLLKSSHPHTIPFWFTHDGINSSIFRWEVSLPCQAVWSLPHPSSTSHSTNRTARTPFSLDCVHETNEAGRCASLRWTTEVTLPADTLCLESSSSVLMKSCYWWHQRLWTGGSGGANVMVYGDEQGKGLQPLSL